MSYKRQKSRYKHKKEINIYNSFRKWYDNYKLPDLFTDEQVNNYCEAMIESFNDDKDKFE